MNDNIIVSLNAIRSILDDYDNVHHTLSEIRELVLRSPINETINFIDVAFMDINRIRDIVDELLEYMEGMKENV